MRDREGEGGKGGGMTAVGFEATRIAPPELESGALDHSAKLSWGSSRARDRGVPQTAGCLNQSAQNKLRAFPLIANTLNISAKPLRPERLPTQSPLAAALCTDGSSERAVAEAVVQTPSLGGVWPGSLHGASLRGRDTASDDWPRCVDAGGKLPEFP